MSSFPNPHYGASGYGLGGYGNEPIECLPIGYYLNLLTHQYRLPNSPKLNALLYVLLKKFDDVSQCLVSLDLDIDLDVAVGAQLDLLGQIQHVSRTVPFQPSNSVSPVLDDATYRLLIKATIGKNQWDGTVDSLYIIWNSLFPSGQIVIEDQQNMTANILLTGSFTSIIQDLITHGMIVPRPEGVLYNYFFGDLPYFGFDLDNSFVAGFDTGHFV
jgi:hypothetical protein